MNRWNLKAVLQEHYTPPEVMGGNDIDRASLRASLTDLLSRLQVLFLIAAAMAVVVFLIEVAVAVTHLGDPQVIKAVGGATGLTIAGALEVIRRITRETTQVSMVIVLCAELDREALAPIVNALVKKL